MRPFRSSAARPHFGSHSLWPLVVLGTGWLAVTACNRTESRILSLLPATTTARVEAAVEVPPEAELSFELAVLEAGEKDPEVSSDARIEVWVHTASEPARRLLASAVQPDRRRVEATVDLRSYEGRRLLIGIVARGLPPERIRWERADLEGEDSVRRFSGPDPETPWQIAPPPEAPDVLLYVIDTLRADTLGVYGGSVPTPHLDRLAEQGIRFENTLTPASWTRPATASLITGLYPSTHGAQDRPHSLPEAAFTLAERLRLFGYRTAGVIANSNVDPFWGFGQGYEVYLRPRVVDPRRPHRHLHGWEVHEAALEHWHRLTDDDRPVFLYVHVVDPHGPFNPPEWLLDSPRPKLDRQSTKIVADLNARRLEPTPDLLDALWTLYRGEVAFTDKIFGDFHRQLTENPRSENLLVAVTSDHGEAFHEHGFSSHGLALYEEEIRVPLILWGPRWLPAGKVIQEPVSLIDLLPTILSFVSTAPREVHGRDLSPLWQSSGTLEPRQLLAEIDYEGRKWSSLRDRDRKLLFHRNQRSFLEFDLSADPEETRNLFQKGSAESRRLLRDLREIRAQAAADRLAEETTAVGEPDPELLENLRALGYIE